MAKLGDPRLPILAAACKCYAYSANSSVGVRDGDMFTPGNLWVRVQSCPHHRYFETPDCTCYFDDYRAGWNLQADCRYHGDAFARAAYIGEAKLTKISSPNHMYDDALGDPNTCVVPEHNHPAKLPPAEDVPYIGPPPPPEHYAGKGGVDPWAFIEAQGLDYWSGNVIKYVTRAGRKEIASRLDDLTKARNFLDYMIKRERDGS